MCNRTEGPVAGANSGHGKALVSWQSSLQLLGQLLTCITKNIGTPRPAPTPSTAATMVVIVSESRSKATWASSMPCRQEKSLSRENPWRFFKSGWQETHDLSASPRAPTKGSWNCVVSRAKRSFVFGRTRGKSRLVHCCAVGTHA